MVFKRIDFTTCNVCFFGKGGLNFPVRARKTRGFLGPLGGFLRARCFFFAEVLPGELAGPGHSEILLAGGFQPIRLGWLGSS